MSEQRQIYQSRQQPRRSSTGAIILLLLLLLVVLVFAYSAARLGKSGPPTTTEGQCLSSGKQFNGRQEAFLLAQQAEQ